MQSLSERELGEILKRNPDLTLGGQGVVAVKHEGSWYYSIGPQSTEHAMQVAVIAACQERALFNPIWSMIFAIPNGGQRTKAQGGKLKAEGVQAGIPDLFVPVARHGRHGLWLELKIGSNKPSKAQQEWIRRLRVEGYIVEVVWDDPQKAIDIIEWYLEK